MGWALPHQNFLFDWHFHSTRHSHWSVSMNPLEPTRECLFYQSGVCHILSCHMQSISLPSLVSWSLVSQSCTSWLGHWGNHTSWPPISSSIEVTTLSKLVARWPYPWLSRSISLVSYSILLHYRTFCRCYMSCQALYKHASWRRDRGVQKRCPLPAWRILLMQSAYQYRCRCSLESYRGPSWVSYHRHK